MSQMFSVLFYLPGRARDQSQMWCAWMLVVFVQLLPMWIFKRGLSLLSCEIYCKEWSEQKGKVIEVWILYSLCSHPEQGSSQGYIWAAYVSLERAHESTDQAGDSVTLNQRRCPGLHWSLLTQWALWTSLPWINSSGKPFVPEVLVINRMTKLILFLDSQIKWMLSKIVFQWISHTGVWIVDSPLHHLISVKDI